MVMSVQEKNYKIGIFYGKDPDAEKLAKKFLGHLINNEDYCKACELYEQKVKCDHCRKYLKSFSNAIYFFEKIGQNAPELIEEPEIFLPESLPPIDFLVIVGIHQDLLAGLPTYLKGKGVKAVIVPLEDPKWVSHGLQVQVLEEFEKQGIQSAFPKPFCALSKEENEYNNSGFHTTKNRSYINEFIDYFKIGEPIVAFLLSEDKKSIVDACVIQSAPCGSTFYIVQQLKAKYIENGKADGLALNERISKAHHAFPCEGSMDQDTILKDSVLHIGGYLIRDAVRRALNLDEQAEKKQSRTKLAYVIK